jgi:excisionase family DNA binding protein
MSNFHRQATAATLRLVALACSTASPVHTVKAYGPLSNRSRVSQQTAHVPHWHNGIAVARLNSAMENERESLRMPTIKETAVMLRMSRRTVHRLIQRKELPSFKVGGQWRLRELSGQVA